MAADDDDKDEAAESSPDADGGESDDARDDEESTLASTPSARAKERERARDRRRRAQRERGDLAEAQESAGRRRNVERVVTFVAGAAVGSLVMFFVLRATNKAAAAAAAADAGAATAGSSTVTAAGGAGLDDAGELAMNEDLLAAAAAAGGGGGGGSGADYRATGTGPGSRMPDGSPVPALSEAAPRVVRFAVVLVSYQGAQGAPPNARSKADAQALATKLAEQAKTDFHGAVAQGDPGSADDAGRIPRGVLELFPEYTLFTLPKGGVSDAVDTPRGFWIVKRTE